MSLSNSDKPLFLWLSQIFDGVPPMKAECSRRPKADETFYQKSWGSRTSKTTDLRTKPYQTKMIAPLLMPGHSLLDEFARRRTTACQQKIDHKNIRITRFLVSMSILEMSYLCTQRMQRH